MAPVSDGATSTADTSPPPSSDGYGTVSILPGSEAASPTTTAVRRCGEPAGRGGDGVEQRVLDDEHVRGGRVDEVLEEGAAVVDVDGNLHGAEPGGREPPDHELGAVAEHQEDAVAAPDAEAREPGSDDLGFGRRLGVGQLSPAEREREEGPVGVRERLLREQAGEGRAGAVGDDEAHR